MTEGVARNDVIRGTVVQLSPTVTRNKAFAACMLTVTEVHSWGVQGYVQAVGESRDALGGSFYCRAQWDEVELVGQAVWMVP